MVDTWVNNKYILSRIDELSYPKLEVLESEIWYFIKFNNSYLNQKLKKQRFAHSINIFNQVGKVGCTN